MPSSSRLADLFGVGSSLRREVPYTGAELGDGWLGIWENGMFGGYLSAVADPANARVRVDLSWPGINYATVYRVHADGTRYEVRGGDPATVLVAWARYDYEPPLDQTVSYEAISAERPGQVAASGPVTVDSAGRFWFKSIAQPSLNMAVRIHTRGQRSAPARAGKVEPPLRPDPIYVYQVRGSDKGTLALYAGDRATEAAIRAILAPGGPVMLQYPGQAGGESLYLMVGEVPRDPLTPMVVDQEMSITLAIDVIGRPSGVAEGGPGNRYQDMSAGAFHSYGQLANAASSYLELSMLGF